ncbi:MAG: glycosyltransferase family 2 protein [Nitrosopumilus sp.]|nr:glycosyltransferase family 2 protein [Nitrosopumilus sp.]MDH3488183.1 glycosyltransferase family 2 protein [Nitrosopumilus sp.]
MNKNTPFVSIIIVNYNGKKFLEDCFHTLQKITYSNFEIILIDNNSTDNSIEFIKNRYPSTIIIKLEKNYGFAYPNNVGAKNAKGDFLLFLNNDTKVHPDFISEMVNVLKKDPKIAISQSMLLKPNGDVDSSGDFIDLIGRGYSSKEKINDIREILSARGAAMMIRKEIFDKLKGFDEKFFVSFEDVDLGWRAWIFGYKVVVIPNSIVYHIGGQTIKKMGTELSFHGFKNLLAMKVTNFEPKFAIKNIFLFFVLEGITMLKVMFDYKFKGTTNMLTYEKTPLSKPSLRSILKGIIWIFSNHRYLIHKQKWINSHRIFGTTDLQKKNVIRNPIS